MSMLSVPFWPRDGHVLQVLLVCRISTENQDEQALADQQALLEAWIRERHKGPVEFTVISGRGSGETIHRPDAEKLEQCIRSRRYDLVIAEDLGRIFRRLQALIVCEICQDHGVRVIAINDQIDTADPNWKLSGMFATLRHEQYNEDTSRRIRRSHRNRFQQGGVVQTFIFGVVKPPGAKTDDELYKDPNADAVYDQWFRILEEGGTYSDVSDWLTANDIPTGPGCRSSRWTAKMVARVTHNPLVKGVRRRNDRMTRRINESGKRQSIPAPPEERLERLCPHLVFIEPERYDRVIRLLKHRNSRYRRRPVNGADPRRNVPKKRTRWPGGHLVCDCCGSPFVYGAHGQTENLMCSASREYACWQSVSTHGPTARRKLAEAIWRELEGLKDFEAIFRAQVEASAAAVEDSRVRRLKELEHRAAALERQRENILRTIREFGPIAGVGEELRRLQDEENQLAVERDELNISRLQSTIIPDLDRIRAVISEALEHECRCSAEGVRLLHQFVPGIRVFPVQLLDGGNPVLRAAVTIDLSPAGAEPLADGLELRRTLVVDLFDPPQREAIRAEVVRLRGMGLSEREVARRLSVTVTAAQRAAALQRMMDRDGVTDPYRRLLEPPSDSGRFRRHRHPRFRGADGSSPAQE